MSISRRRVDYDEIAAWYDGRYSLGQPEGVAAALRELAREVGAGRILEVGCGTGHWLAALRPFARQVFGLDRSPAMLQQARLQNEAQGLVRGQASWLPLSARTFDLVFCVNAIHHFDRPRAFVAEAHRLLRPGGMRAVAGMAPHRRRDRWYIYDYFAGTLEADLDRFPSPGAVADWMVTAGFEEVVWRLVDRIAHHWVGREVLHDPILQKNGTSQLALLTDEAYAAGVDRIRRALAEAAAAGGTPVFPVDLSFAMISGRASERIESAGQAGGPPAGA